MMNQRKHRSKPKQSRRRYTDEFKDEAVELMLDGHSAHSVTERLGLPSAALLYRWTQERLRQSGPMASTLEARVRDLEAELRRVERERDILKKAMATFGRSE